jgi:hypothetical protein
MIHIVTFHASALIFILTDLLFYFAEEKKVEKKEESDSEDDLGFGLFD